MLIHESLQFFFMNGTGSSKIIEEIMSVDNMREWEFQFDQLFIAPVLNVSIKNIFSKLIILYYVYAEFFKKKESHV